MDRWLVCLYVIDDLVAIWNFLAVEEPTRSSDLIFCFGNANLKTAQTAARLYHDKVAPLVLVSGGSRAKVDHFSTEAEGFHHELVAAGVPDSAIIVEPHAGHTGENIDFGWAELAKRGIELRSVVAVPFAPATRRTIATLRFKQPGLQVAGIPGFTGMRGYIDDPYRVARMVLDEIDKLYRYPKLGYFEPVLVPIGIASAVGRVRRAYEADAVVTDHGFDSTEMPVHQRPLG